MILGSAFSLKNVFEIGVWQTVEKTFKNLKNHWFSKTTGSLL